MGKIQGELVDRAVLLLILLGAGALGWRLFRENRGGPSSIPEALQSGTLLPAVTVRGTTTGNRGQLSFELAQSPHRCQVLIFYSSSCPACHKIAPHWNGMREVRIGERMASVRWVAGNPADTGAATFLSTFALDPGLQFTRATDRVDFGIIAWPTVYLVTRAGTFLRELPLLPQQLDSLDAPACQES